VELEPIVPKVCETIKDDYVCSIPFSFTASSKEHVDVHHQVVNQIDQQKSIICPQDHHHHNQIVAASNNDQVEYIDSLIMSSLPSSTTTSSSSPLSFYQPQDKILTKPIHPSSN
jgi:hypothetical protein